MIASIILILYFIGALSLNTAIVCLYVSGLLLFVAEVGIMSLGLLTLNGLLALYAGFALQTGNTMFMGVEIGWGLLFGIACVEFVLVFAGIWLWRTHKNISPAAGTDAMIGKKATVVEWSGKAGKISYEGEIWKASSEREIELSPQEFVTIRGIDKLTLIVSA